MRGSPNRVHPNSLTERMARIEEIRRHRAGHSELCCTASSGTIAVPAAPATTRSRWASWTAVVGTWGDCRLNERIAGLMLRTWARPKFAGLGVTWIAAVAVVLWLVLAGRQEALRRGLEDTAALTAVIEQLTARTFQALYLTLSSVADAHQLQPRPAKNDPAFQQLLTYRLQDVPFARALFIIGPDGWLIHDTDYPSTPNLSLFDRPYFQAYLENSERFATAWPPLESRSGTGWFVPVTEPLSRSAEFEGVVAAALQADHFTQELERM